MVLGIIVIAVVDRRLISSLGNLAGGLRRERDALDRDSGSFVLLRGEGIVDNDISDPNVSDAGAAAGDGEIVFTQVDRLLPLIERKRLISGCTPENVFRISG